MSLYTTITSLAESPKQEGLLYAGTDDGLLQVSEDGGESWRKIEVGSLPGVPASAFVNDVKADLLDAGTVYVALDDHKSGDFRPYLLKSTDRGRTWRSIVGDLPARHLVWRLVQDHVKPDLLFAGTEFGIFFTTDGGARWVELDRRRADDLLPRPRHPAPRERPRGRRVRPRLLRARRLLRAARGPDEALAEGCALFPVARGLVVRGAHPARATAAGRRQGAAFFVAPNPPFGAVFTYHLADELRGRAKQRQERREAARRSEEGHAVPRVGRARGRAPRDGARGRPHGARRRRRRGAPGRGDGGEGLPSRGLGPAAPAGAIRSVDPASPDEEGDGPQGVLAAPGTYTVSLAKRVDGATTELAGPVPFEVARLRPGALPGADPKETAAFLARVAEVSRATGAATQAVTRALERVETLGTALGRSRSAPGGLDAELHAIRQELHALDEALVGNRARASVEDDGVATITRRVQVAQMGTAWSTYGPTPTHRRSLEIGEKELAAVRERLNAVLEQRLPALEKKLEQAGAPWTPGRPVPPLP